MIVYRIKNKINGKLYFGITKCTLQKRWNEHKHNSLRLKKKSHLNLAIKKYGYLSFEVSVVEICKSEKQMYELEVKLIKEFNTTNHKFGYNNSTGGERSSKGKKLSEEMRKKISDFQKSRIRLPHSKVTIEKIRNASFGRDMKKAIESSANSRRGKLSHNIRPVILNGCKKYVSVTDAARQNGCSLSSIINNISGLSKKTKLGTWQYL